MQYSDPLAPKSSISGLQVRKNESEYSLNVFIDMVL
jgi:hypothetical protein